MAKWITEIKRSGDVILFILNDDSIIPYKIVLGGEFTYLYYSKSDHDNGYIFEILGIEKYKFYEDLGIKSRIGGACPYCKEEDLDILFKALVEWRPEGFEESKKTPSKWDWLLD